MLLTPLNSFSAVSLTPMKNFRFFGYFWPVSTTPGKNFIAGVNNTKDKLFAGVNNIAYKLFTGVNRHGSCIHRHPPHLDKRPLRLPKLQKNYIKFWRPQGPMIRICGVPMEATFHGGSNDTIGSHVRLQRPEISLIWPLQLLLFLAAPHLHGVHVLVTGNKFITGVIVTGDNCSPVSLSLAINLSLVSTTPVITENPWQFIAGVVDTGEQFIAGVVDTRNKHSFVNSSANFLKVSKRPQWNTWGPGGQWFMKKNLKSKILFRTRF